MALDFSAIKQKLAKSQTKNEKKDFSKIYWKPSLGKQKIRIVPWKENPSNPFIELQLHSYNTFKKFIPTLANFGEADPILQMREKVFKDPTSTEEDKQFMKAFTPKNANFVQVIVRGQEDLGVRLFELNKTNFEQVASILVEEDEYGNCIDIASGRDFIIDGYSEVNPQTGKSYTAISVKPSAKQTPLSDNAELVKKWLVEQNVPIEQYKRYTREEITQLVEAFLNPADGSEDEAEAPAPAPKQAPKAPAKAPVAKPVFTKLEEEPEEAVLDPIDAEDELSEAIPKTPKVVEAPKVVKAKPAPKAPAAKPAPKAPAAKPATTAAAKFSSMFDEED